MTSKSKTQQIQYIGQMLTATTSQDRTRIKAAIAELEKLIKLPFKAWKIGNLLLTWCNQGQGAPIVDSATTRDDDGNRYKGKAILLKPWRKNKHGEHLPQPALVIAWRNWR